MVVDAMQFEGPRLVLFLNTVLSLGCTLCTVLGLWPFRGLLHAWLFKRQRYTWTTHVMYGWFGTGCLGLLVTNVYALLRFVDTAEPEAQTPSTGDVEGYRMTLVLNAVMHGAWGAHNLLIALRILAGPDRGTVDEWRRPMPMMVYSLIGACGAACVRNVHALRLIGDVDAATNDTVVRGIWAWEWLCLVILLADLGYFLRFEHTWGMSMKNATPTARKKQG